ncbi:DUF3281 family protein [Francisella hispaniensis]|uniref:DUF3281 family protein n=1 Tax=Francisella hispaniensis TaxID=622488 RepID=UPI00190636B6|nr:DUF3281 family protein [Francisella hispaniensis]MBK2356642.1 DUF3281 family protein [Francisella hispaniensis]
MITKKRLVLGAAIISSTVLLASCGKTTTAKELRIIDNCTEAKDLCEFELTDAVVSRYTNILGKTIERVESKTPLHDSDIKGTITWNAPGSAALADNASLQSVLGVSCQDDKCTENSNPTAYKLAAGSNTISVSGTVTVDGQTIDLATDVKPITEDTEAVENTYTFQKGDLPSGATIPDLVKTLNANASKANGSFIADGSGSFKIQCNTGYTWLKDVDPAYGTEFNEAGNGRSIAVATWSTTDNKWTASAIDSSGYTQDGIVKGDNVSWMAGCWPDQ